MRMWTNRFFVEPSNTDPEDLAHVLTKPLSHIPIGGTKVHVRVVLAVNVLGPLDSSKGSHNKARIALCAYGSWLVFMLITNYSSVP